MSTSRDETGKEDRGFVSRRICENTWMCWTLRGKEALAGGDRSAKRFGVSRKITRPAFFLCSGRTVCRGRRDAQERRLSGWHGVRGRTVCRGRRDAQERRLSDMHFIKSTNGYVQDERYIAIEHMDVRRDCLRHALCMFGLYLTRNSLVLRQGSKGHAVPLFRTRSSTSCGTRYSTSCLVRS